MTARIATIQASTARTVSGSIDMGALPAEFMELNIYIDVTAIGGTAPTMTVTYQASPDGVTFYDHTAGAAIMAVGRQLIRIPANAGNFGSLSYVIGGTTPSLTFSAVVGGKRP